MAFDTQWTKTWPNSNSSNNDEDEKIIKDAKQTFTDCEDWEAQARTNFDYDYKFANGDMHNKYQWDDTLVQEREDEGRPCLTINKTQQHNLIVINDAKQNKPGIRIRPVGDEATFEAAQVYQELVYHIEYISNAESIYDSATTFQVEAGMGYWRVITDFISNDSFDQEIYIKRIKDPRLIYLDRNINEVDGSDARKGIIFDDMEKELFKATYPDFEDIAGQNNTVNANGIGDGWITKNTVKVAEFFIKDKKKDKLVTYIDPQSGEQVLKKLSELSEDQKKTWNEQKPIQLKAGVARERDILIDDIMIYKIAGNKIIEKSKWLGKYIPIIRLPGTETVIDGILDWKGHTRALINPQQMYNYNSSASIEYGALQTKAPWLAPMDAIEGFEEYYKTANTVNHSYLPYNHMGEDGQPIPPPSRPAAPQASPAYVEQLKIAQNEMMMASGQYQSQMGENENAKSGVAINARQRQGDRATYHFIDNLAIAIRFTGKIIIDLIPKIYDTKRVRRISTTDNKIMNVTIDPNAEKGYQKTNERMDEAKGQKVEDIIFNPGLGMYDIQSDTGPSFATRRQEAFNAMTQIATQNKDFMQIAGDLYFKVADFPEADALAQRWSKVIPPNITGDAPDPATEDMMHKSADKIEQLTGVVSQQAKELADRQKEFDLKEQALKLQQDELALKLKEATAEAHRLDYDAETKRLVALGNSGPGVSPQAIAPVVQSLLIGMLNAGEPGAGDRMAEAIRTAPLPPQETNGGASNGATGANGREEPPMPGARKAGDGMWYLDDPDRPGKYLQVGNAAEEGSTVQ